MSARTAAGQALSTGAPRAHPPADVALAVGTAAVVMTGSALILRAAALRDDAALREVDVGTGAVIAVRPVLDPSSPLLKLGGGRAPKLPAQWSPRKPKRAPASAPVPETSSPPQIAPKPAGEPSKQEQATGTVDDTSPGGAAPAGSAGAGGAVSGSPGNEADSDGGAPFAPPGPGGPEGSPGGTSTDPLAARALDVYRARIVSWFSSRFRVTGSGLSQSTLTSLRASATVQIGPDGRVTSYSLTSSGNTVFDAAARAALESSRGQAIPPPPESYPELAQSSISLTFVCKEGRCD